MEAFAAFNNKWLEIMSKNGIVIDNCLRKDFEDEMLHLFLKIDSTLAKSQEVLNMKNDELIKTMAKSQGLESELYMVKDSARSIVKCLNMSLKASSNIIARTIIEMVARDQLHLIDVSVESSIHKFCQKHNCSVRKYI